MKKVVLLSLALSVIWFLPLWSTTIHIPGDFSTIQAGIDASVNGDTVVVASGVYGEHITFSGKSILLKSENGPDETVIESVNNGTPIVRFENGEGQNSILDGFTIRNANGAPAINISYAGPTIINNKFINNINSDSDGGAINAVYGTLLRIIDNVFEANSSVYGTGGGVRSYGLDLIISGNVFRSNNAGTHGGAIHLRASNESVVDHNLFVDNHCLAIGGGLTLSEDQGAEVFNNTFVSNSSVEPHGAGIAIWYSSNCHLYNNIIVNNDGMGIHSYPPNNSTTTYSDVWNNAIDYDGIDPGDGSISADPLFVGGDPYSYELTAESPCIDAGDPNSPPDPNGSIADMGAYSYGGIPGGTYFDIVDLNGQTGLPVDVPVTAVGFSQRQIAGLEFHIAYRTNGLEFTGLTSDYLADALVNDVEGTINIVWENFAAPITVPEESDILTLHFNVTGPNGSAYRIEWHAGSEVVDTLGNPITRIRYYDGGVSVMEPRNLSGHLVYYDLQRSLANITISLSRDDTATTVTDTDGEYFFDSLALGNYLVCPSRADDDPGVTIADIIMIERHLAQLEIFDSPYKDVAGDVNGSGTVSMADVIKIRRYLAQLEPLPAGNWAFVDSAYVITPTNWPQAPACREANLIGSDLTDVNLIGIRVGDVDNSWTFLRGDFAQPLTRIDDPSISLGQTSGNPGDIVSLPLTANELPGVAGLELHFDYPAEGLRFTGITSNLPSEPTIGGGNGVAHLVWENGLNTVDLVGGAEIASINFEILAGAPEIMTVSIHTGYVVNRDGGLISAAFGDGQIGLLTSNGSEPQVPEAFGLGQNYPNPFNARTRISFSISKPCHVNLDVFDMTGRMVSTLENGHFEAGIYSVIWDGRSDSGMMLSSGIYFYRLKTDNFQDTKRMLMLK
jgi:parallel beta-helix repeat protein